MISILKYQKGYIFNGTTFVVRKEDVHNASDDMFVEATALLPVPDVISNGEYIRASDEQLVKALVYAAAEGCPPKVDWHGRECGSCKKNAGLDTYSSQRKENNNGPCLLSP